MAGVFVPAWTIEAGGNPEVLPPVRALTREPGYHWFGYYDKWEFDVTDRFVLGMQVDFESRTPRADDVIRIGMVDLEDGDRWVELGASRAWSWQQGCMLQWRPGFRHEIVWNDREDNRFVCHILNTQTGRKRTLPHPIYCLSPDGKTALGVDFARIQHTRPGYGYPGFEDPYAADSAPEESGVYRLDMESGKREVLFSLAEVAAIPFGGRDLGEATHWFNHLLFSPDGSRFIVLHRWRWPEGGRYQNVGGFGTRMITSDADGGNRFILDDSGFTSHFIWRDPDHVLVWTRLSGSGPGFYLFRDRTGEVEPVGADIMTRNGHCTYLAGGRWILNDTYPDRDRNQHVYLYHVDTGRKVLLGKFYSPPQYQGEWRVDTHPRSSRDGTKVVIDSPHDGNGRQLYLIDIGGIVGV